MIVEVPGYNITKLVTQDDKCKQWNTGNEVVDRWDIFMIIQDKNKDNDTLLPLKRKVVYSEKKDTSSREWQK